MTNATPLSGVEAVTPHPQPGVRAEIGVVGTHPWHGVLIVTAISFAVLVLLAAVVPYHIDELRQVGLYSRDLAEIPQATLEMQQPPLDTLTNALAHRVLGPGDVRERLMPIFFGCAALLLLGRLGITAGLRWGAVVAVGTLAVLPVFLRTTPYARQYALPTFLMLLVLYCIDRWLHQRETGWLWATGVASVLLVLSRSTDPVLFLISTAAVLAVVGYLGRHRLPGGWGSVRRPVVITAGTAALVGAPLLLLLRRYMQGVGLGGGGFPLPETLARMVSESAGAISEALPLWPVLVLLIIFGATQRRGRSLLLRAWWIWPLVGTTVLFVVSFFVLTSAAGTPFSERYLYMLMPAVAAVAGVSAEALFAWNWRGVVVAVSLGGFLVSASAQLLTRVVEPPGYDWEVAAQTVTETLDDDWSVVFDHPRPVTQYRTPFAGQGRYLDRGRVIPNAPRVLREPDVLPEDHFTAILLLNLHLSVDGWYAVSTGGGGMFLYLPHEPERWIGRKGAGEAMALFGRAIGDHRGTYLMAAAAALLRDQGEAARAQAVEAAALEQENANAEALQHLLVRDRPLSFMRTLLDPPLGPLMSPGAS